MFEAILDEWSIDSGKVKAIVTDNNSNVVKAFGNDVQENSEMDEDDQANSDLAEIIEFESMDDVDLSAELDEYEDKEMEYEMAFTHF